MSAPNATAPNGGAHRLAWWLAQGDDARVRQLEPAVAAPSIDRLLTGELIPAEDVAVAIAAATGGDVLPGDWEQGGTAWDAAPMPRPTP